MHLNISKKELTKIHDVIPANGTVIDHDVYYRQSAPLAQSSLAFITYPKPKELLHSTI